MSFKQILFSILIGIAAGLLTIYIIPADFEIMLWILIMITVGYIAATHFSSGFFKRAFIFSLPVGVSITASHILLADNYANTHSRELEELKKLLPVDSLELMLIINAPFYWVLLGLLSGLSAIIIRKFRYR